MSQTNPVPKPAATQDEKEKEHQRKIKHRRNHPDKIRVKLPSIETYQKEVVFRAEGPGRVVVRLERLMGSDRVRLTDQKFMATLLERLEGDEHKAWVIRTISRKKAESTRTRQLCIDGLMEPASDMQDLYNHPVFRVNRVLKRLAQFDHQMNAGQEIHLPPMTPIDPFVNDDTGAIFKHYPGHTPVEAEPLPDLTLSQLELYAELNGTLDSAMKMSIMKAVAVEDEEVEQEGEEQEEKEWDGEGDPPKDTSKIPLDATLTELQQGYGIQPDEDLEADWEPFRSHLVDLLFSDDAGDFSGLYEVAEQVIGVYDRENAVADDFVNKLPKMMH